MSKDNRWAEELFPDLLERHDAGELDAPDAPDAHLGASLAPSGQLPPAHSPSPSAPGGMRQDGAGAGERDTAVPEDDPYANAPEWARAHIPRRNLLDSLPAPLPRRRPNRTALLLAGAGVGAAVLFSAAAAAALVGGESAPQAGDHTDATTTTTVPAAAASTAVAAPQPWCPRSSVGAVHVSDGPGDPATPVGAITAFDYAYYTLRDGVAVAALTSSAKSAEEIQEGIDALPLGTEHCLTITSTDTENVYAVSIALRTPSGEEGQINQRVTLAPGGPGYQIARVEQLR